MAVTGPDFISLQVRDLERSAAFYEQYLGLKRSDAGPPHAVVFDTKPIAFAVRDVVAGTDLDAIAQPGQGMALWLHAPDAQDIHDALAAAGTPIVSAPVERAVRPHFHVRGPRRLPGDPPRPRLSRASWSSARQRPERASHSGRPAARVRPGPPPRQPHSCVFFT